ncbi:P-loop NTPase [Halorubrum sp. JWXQ-INN 858]|uniref:Mrp/NBP35 family ATP-binding protein n=1 Tax=Halorubrum sp. JWXQ-INN 858 TaxID=2690782 RepID=UPI00135BECCC|nr:Mrp/NBP35 family ATP-binding protein [Halorubrum sp. JWXQ-INN 858]MWV65935.1 P-loop NTPase [Halorubrum sp. JWXQ-INN 858]
MTDTLTDALRTVPTPTPPADSTTKSSRTNSDAVRGDIVSEGLVGRIQVDGETAHVELALGAPHSPAETDLTDAVREAIRSAGYEPSLSVDIDDTTPAGVSDDTPIVIAVSSGKGGVGKSTVAVNLAVGMSERGASVGIFDADVFGPNIPRMLGVKDEMAQPGGPNTILPVEAHSLKVLSVGFMVDDANPITWRGPVVDQMLGDLWHDVEWGDVDYLIVDLPPGTGDAQLTMLQQMPVMGSVVVTTPQNVALDNARKGITQFEPHEAEVFGIVENMSSFMCPTCNDHHEIFAAGGGDRLAEEFDLPVLSRIPIDPAIGEAGEIGEPIVLDDSETAAVFRSLAGDVMDEVGWCRQHSHQRNTSTP